MTPKKHGEDICFSVQEAADVLGVTRQAVYAAIRSGYLKTAEAGNGKRIKVQELMGYGIRVGKAPNVLVERIKQQTGADMKDLLLWVLAGLGLYFLVKSLIVEK